MSDKELVERLLDFDKVTVGDARDAALRIEQLVAINEALTKERDDYAFKLADANNTYNEMHVALSEANDKLAKAVEGLREWDDLIKHQYSGSREAMSDMTYAAQHTAALLGEIESSEAAPPYGLEGEKT
jgi:hypothetical protein